LLDTNDHAGVVLVTWYQKRALFTRLICLQLYSVVRFHPEVCF